MVDFELEDELNQILRSNLNLLIIESLSLSPLIIDDRKNKEWKSDAKRTNFYIY